MQKISRGKIYMKLGEKRSERDDPYLSNFLLAHVHTPTRSNQFKSEIDFLFFFLLFFLSQILKLKRLRLRASLFLIVSVLGATKELSE